MDKNFIVYQLQYDISIGFGQINYKTFVIMFININ